MGRKCSYVWFSNIQVSQWCGLNYSCFMNKLQTLGKSRFDFFCNIWTPVFFFNQNLWHFDFFQSAINKTKLLLWIIYFSCLALISPSATQPQKWLQKMICALLSDKRRFFLVFFGAEVADSRATSPQPQNKKSQSMLILFCQNHETVTANTLFLFKPQWCLDVDSCVAKLLPNVNK